ncbi:MAG TPA: ArsC family reductase [Ramlibacter sp.]|jgi:Spx/MgsR family transcriptional regulator|uniref:ArsC family reductase n=1 Tax=Ramlibacter sp. TaxID=1917967 RepID=UPI002D282FC5|nr:ArsC family reductase [Ramlibacter sp.]HZY19097.1 ArsC family reductase [Ramlibacter sp.]
MDPSPVLVYGIPNCDTVKKARAWLDARGVPHRFHDLRKDGVPAERLAAWSQEVGWERLVNRQGTTWRKLDTPTQAQVTDEASARELMARQPSVIKRPVVEWPGRTTVGFDPATWDALVSSR